MSHFTEIRNEIAKLAKEQRRIHDAYSLPHGTNQSLLKERLKPVVPRDEHSLWLTALHIAYAEARGKKHCDVATWIKSQLWFEKRAELIEKAKALIPAIVEQVA